MADYILPKYGVAYTDSVMVYSVATAGSFQVNPTIAAGDFKISKDGGAFANLTNLPVVTPAGSQRIEFTLTDTEMQADNITFLGIDAAGNEWYPVNGRVQTAVRGVADLAYPTVSGRSLDVSATGEAGIDWANVGSPTTTVAFTGTTISTAQIAASVTGAVGSVTGLTASNLDAAISTRATPAQILTTALTESYAADGVAPTVTQALFLIQQSLTEFAISGTTITAKQLDGSTTAATYTLDSATVPTSRTRAT